MEYLKNSFLKRIEKSLKSTHLSVNQRICIIYFFIKIYNKGFYLQDIKIMFSEFFKDSKFKSLLIWIINTISNIASKIFSDYLIITITFIIVILFPLSDRIKHNKLSEILWNFSYRILNALFYAFSNLWIYYILALELKTTRYVHLNDFNVMILLLYLIYIILSLIKRPRNESYQKYSEDLNDLIKRNFQPATRYIPIKSSKVDEDTTIYFVVEKYDKIGICFVAHYIRDTEPPIPLEKYYITNLCECEDIELVEKYFDYIDKNYKKDKIRQP